MKKIFERPFYPLLFAVYPILYLYSRNMEIFAFRDTLRSMLLSFAAAVILLVYLRFVLKDWHRSALLTVLLLGLFFSFGHVANLLESWGKRGGPVISVIALGWIWLAALVLLPVLIIRTRSARGSTLTLNVLATALLGFSLVSIAQVLIFSPPEDAVSGVERLSQMRGGAQAEYAPAENTPAAPPDIYYIILDSYERIDALQKYYHFDNSAFVQALAARGFYVADQSRSNYMTTAYSLPSSLNLVYLNDLPAGLFTRMISGLQINFVNDFLRARGYQTVRFESGFAVTDDVLSDYVESPFPPSAEPSEEPAVLNQFELLLLQTTPGRLLYAISTADSEGMDAMLNTAIEEEFLLRRQRIEHAFGHLDDYAAAEGHYFLFAHIITPHNPYLYGPQGERIDYNGNDYLLGDKLAPERDIKLYTDQLQHINQMTLDLIDRILAESVTPPVIILQADHGHDTYFEWESSTREGVDLRSAILNAYYFPNGAYQNLYPSISPVNSFRVVLNQFFGTHFELLPDRSYNHKHPNSVPVGVKPALWDLCEQFSVCSPDRSGGP